MPEKETTHVLHMRHALDLANEALADGDWPVAAVIARGDEILSTGRGRQNTASDPTAHAETDALAQARRAGVSVAGATLYCTMEPCPMCAFALHLHGIRDVVLGARHADLRRTDLGAYSIESFAEMMGIDLRLTTGIENDACVALRRAWGRDQTR